MAFVVVVLVVDLDVNVVGDGDGDVADCNGLGVGLASYTEVAIPVSSMLLSTLILLTSAANCEHGKEKDGEVCHHAPTTKSAPAKSDAALLLRGDKLSGLPKTEMTALLKSPGDFDGKTVALEAKVRKACEKKGCWMELSPANGEGPGVRVTFKDYGFFVPLDSAGRTAKVEGLIKVAELSAETAKHYESEGAIVPRGKDGKPREVQLIASGLELRK